MFLEINNSTALLVNALTIIVRFPENKKIIPILIGIGLEESKLNQQYIKSVV